MESLLINEGLGSLNVSQTSECVSVWKQKEAEKEEPLNVGGDLDLVVRSGKLDLQSRRPKGPGGGRRWMAADTDTNGQNTLPKKQQSKPLVGFKSLLLPC